MTVRDEPPPASPTAPTSDASRAPGAEPASSPEATEDGGRARDLARRARGLPAWLPLVLIAAGGWMHRWSSEDAFINFRIVDNLFAGNGPVFNAGERVEAGTSPLWLAVLAAGRVAFGWFLSIEWIAVVAALAAAVAAFALAGRSARLLSADRTATVVPVGALVVSSIAVFWDWATSGLEMSLAWLWIAASWYVLCRLVRDGAPSGRRRALAVAVLGLAPLIRPDLGVMMVCFAAAWFRLVRPRRVAADLGAMLALPVAYQIFRMGYYASIVPSTALAKDAGGIHLRQGVDYLHNFVDPYVLWVPLVVIVAAIARLLRTERDGRLTTAVAAVVGAAALHAAYITVVGGDYMHGRLLLPATFALALPAVVVIRARPVVSLALCGVAAAWAVIAIVAFRPPLTSGDPDDFPPDIADWRELAGARVTSERVTLYPTEYLLDEIHDRGVRGYMRVLDDEVRPGRDPDALVVTLGSIGIPAYQLGTDVWVIDIGGLAEPLAARTEPVPGRQAGHRKDVDPAWYDARFGVVGDDPKAQEAARALECGQIEDLLDAVTGDLTPGRFLSNIWHSAGYTRMEIPADPGEAVARYC